MPLPSLVVHGHLRARVRSGFSNCNEVNEGLAAVFRALATVLVAKQGWEGLRTTGLTFFARTW